MVSIVVFMTFLFSNWCPPKVVDHLSMALLMEVVNHLCHTYGMGSQHRYPARALRPPPQLWKNAQAHARQHQLDMNTYLVACVRWLAEQPDTALQHIRPFSEGLSPRGRPHRDSGGTATTS